MTTPNEANQEGLTPNSLVEQLFNAALMHSATKDPREISQQVIDFLGAALAYALTSAKRDIVVYLTEVLVAVVSTSSANEEKRGELFKQLAATFTNAATAPANKAAAAPKP